MHTQSVTPRTAAHESSETWGKTIRRVLNNAHYNVASAEEAHAHYGDPFTRFDICTYFLRGIAESLRRISGTP